jgi:transporter family-2 protein
VEALALPLLLVVGGLLALQAAANVQLAAAMNSRLAASTAQLAIGAALLLMLSAGLSTIAALHLLPGVAPWHLLGGLASALYITAGITLLPRLGAVVTVGLFITGQMLASILLDGLGLLGVEPRPLGVVTLLGLAAVLAGAALIVRAQRGGAELPRPRLSQVGLVALALAAGAGLPAQGAINAQLRLDLGAPIPAAATSFAVATTAMAVVLLASRLLTGEPRPRLTPLRRLPWWAWAGGPVGATYVTCVFLLIPVIGAAPTLALTVAGQQVASVLVDRLGLWRLPRRPIVPTRLAGVATLLLGVALLQLVP